MDFVLDLDVLVPPMTSYTYGNTLLYHNTSNRTVRIRVETEVREEEDYDNEFDAFDEDA